MVKVFNIDLSKREIILISVLNVLLICTVYYTLVRSPLVESIDSLWGELLYIDDEVLVESDPVDNKKIEVVEENNNYFLTSSLDKEVFDQLDIELEKKLESQIFTDDSIEGISSRDISYIGRSTLENFKKLLGDLETDFEKVSQLNLSRLDKEDFEFQLVLQRYTSGQVPYSGVVRNDDYTVLDEDGPDLLDEVYGEEESEIATPTMIKPKAAVSSSSNKVVSKKEVEPEEEEVEIVLPDDLEKYEDIDCSRLFYYKNVNTKYRHVYESFITNDYFCEENFEEEKDNLRNFIIDDDLLYISLKGTEVLDLTTAPIAIEEPGEFYSVEVFYEKPIWFEIEFVDAQDNIFKINSDNTNVDIKGDFDEILFNMPRVDEAYPIHMTKISTESDKDSGEIFFRNFLRYEWY